MLSALFPCNDVTLLLYIRFNHFRGPNHIIYLESRPHRAKPTHINNLDYVLRSSRKHSGLNDQLSNGF